MSATQSVAAKSPSKVGAAAPKKFTVVLMTIYSVENAGIRYVSAALQRAGFETHIVFLRDWRHKRALQAQELGELRAKVHEGLADIEAGRVHDFDAERIIRRGEEQLQGRDGCA